MEQKLISLADYRLSVEDAAGFSQWLNDNGVRSRLLSLGTRVMALRGFNIHHNPEKQLIIPVTFSWYVDAYLSGVTLQQFRSEEQNA